jgi:ABC-type multidrug transport system fused ATPase/permease subunit
MKKILEIASTYKKELFFIYCLILLDALISISLPNLLGKAINGLIVNDYISLIIYFFAIVCLGSITFKRFIYDTKIFTKIYNKLCLEYLDKKLHVENDGVITSRMQMSHRLVNFFENTVYYTITTLANFIGGIYYIFTKDAYVGFITLLFAIPTTLIALYYYKKNRTITKLSNDLNEQVVERIKTKDIGIINSFLNRQRKVDILHSNVQGHNWTAIFVIKYLFLSLCLIIYIKYGIKDVKNSVGDIMALYLYLQNFLTAFYSIPALISEYLSIKDITKRLEN